MHCVKYITKMKYAHLMFVFASAIAALLPLLLLSSSLAFFSFVFFFFQRLPTEDDFFATVALFFVDIVIFGAQFSISLHRHRRPHNGYTICIYI